MRGKLLKTAENNVSSLSSVEVPVTVTVYNWECLDKIVRNMGLLSRVELQFILSKRTQTTVKMCMSS